MRFFDPIFCYMCNFRNCCCWCMYHSFCTIYNVCRYRLSLLLFRWFCFLFCCCCTLLAYFSLSVSQCVFLFFAFFLSFLVCHFSLHFECFSSRQHSQIFALFVCNGNLQTHSLISAHISSFFFTYFVWLARCGVYGAVICLPAIATMLCFAMTFFLSFSQPLSSLFMHRHTFVQLHTYVDNGLIQHIHIIPCRTHTYNSREVHQQQRLKTKQREKKHNFLVPYVCLRIAREKK